MVYEILAKVQQSGPANSTAECAINAQYGEAFLSVQGATKAWVTWVGETEYSMETGNAAGGYSFKGPDPHAGLVELVTSASEQSADEALATHISDYQAALGGFSLSLGQKVDIVNTTAELKSVYEAGVGNP